MTLASLDLTRYQAVLFDLDGTLHLDFDPLPGAIAFVGSCRAAGKSVGFVTNAGHRSSAELLAGLRGMGLAVEAPELMTAVDAVAHALLGDRVERAAVLGSPALVERLRAVGLAAMEIAQIDDEESWLAQPAVTALVVGGWPSAGSDEVDRAARLSRRLPAFATTVEGGMPTRAGIMPGAETLIAQIRARQAEFDPIPCGKPWPPLQDLVREFVGAGASALVVGDAPLADVALARELGWDSLLVRTGVSAAGGTANPSPSPTFIADDLCAAHAAAF